MGEREELFVSSGELRLWTERFGSPADPAVPLIMRTSAQGIGWPQELVKAIVAGGRQVIRFDHRDTGRSTCVDFATSPHTRSSPRNFLVRWARSSSSTLRPRNGPVHG